NTSDEAMGRADSRRRLDPPYRYRLSVPEARSAARPTRCHPTGARAEGLPHPGPAAFSRVLLIPDDRAAPLTYRRQTCAQRPPEPSVLCRTVAQARSSSRTPSPHDREVPRAVLIMRRSEYPQEFPHRSHDLGLVLNVDLVRSAG